MCINYVGCVRAGVSDGQKNEIKKIHWCWNHKPGTSEIKGHPHASSFRERS